jgi:hypothetical protein
MPPRTHTTEVHDPHAPGVKLTHTITEDTKPVKSLHGKAAQGGYSQAYAEGWDRIFGTGVPQGAVPQADGDDAPPADAPAPDAPDPATEPLECQGDGCAPA